MNIDVVFVLAVAIAVAIRSTNQANQKRKLQEFDTKRVAEMPKKP